MSILKTESLTKTFRGKRGSKVQAVQDLNIKLDQGTVFGFIGPNGAGKSTSIKMIVNFLKPTSGRAEINGLPVNNPKSRQNVGYLPENPRYYGYLTAYEFLMMTACLKNVPQFQRESIVNDLLTRFDLTHAKDRSIQTFSKGMVQRVGFANALVGEPDILILDEPMSGLDPVGRELFNEIMIELKQKGTTLFFSSHILHDIETLCDQIGIIIKGKLKFQGDIDTVLEQTFSDYTIKLENVPPGSLKVPPFSNLKQQKEHDGTITLFVPKQEITSYLSLLTSKGFKLKSLEPQRKSLQEFFMDILEKSNIQT